MGISERLPFFFSGVKYNVETVSFFFQSHGLPLNGRKYVHVSLHKTGNGLQSTS